MQLRIQLLSPVHLLIKRTDKRSTHWTPKLRFFDRFGAFAASALVATWEEGSFCIGTHANDAFIRQKHFPYERDPFLLSKMPPVNS